jgi:hypothetical protein
MKYRMTVLALVLACSGLPGFGAGGQIEKLTAANMSEFLARFERDLKQANLDLGHLSDAKLPLLDEAGHPLGRRRITDRRQTLVDLEKTLKGFERDRQDLVSALTLSDQTEELADEVYDLSQIAYDNDREELAMEFTDLLKALNDDVELVQAYALSLAEQKEQELRELQNKT